jgi:hypothetical protein
VFLHCLNFVAPLGMLQPKPRINCRFRNLRICKLTQNSEHLFHLNVQLSEMSALKAGQCCDGVEKVPF